MSVKNDIYSYTGEKFLFEMATKELQKVVPKIDAENYEDAAKEYLDAGGSPDSAGMSRSVNSFLKKNPGHDDTKFMKFQSAVLKQARGKGLKSGRPDTYDVKSNKMGKTKTGEEIIAAPTSGAARSGRIDDLIEKQKQEIDKERAILKSGNTEEVKKLAKDFFQDLLGSRDPEDMRFKRILNNFIDTGKQKDMAIEIMEVILDAGEKTFKGLKYVASQPQQKFKPTASQEAKLKKIHQEIEAKKKGT